MTRVQVLWSLTLTLSALGGANAQDSVAADARYTNAASALTTLIDHERTQKRIPALSIALVNGDRIVWARGFGWVDSAAGTAANATTVYRVGPVSELFTDIAIMQLVERKQLELDSIARQYLPDFRPVSPYGGEITLRQLAAHRSGLIRDWPYTIHIDEPTLSLAEIVPRLNATVLPYRPGTHTKYSDAGIGVLGDILEQTQHEPFSAYVQRAVIGPMGLSHSSFVPTPDQTSKLAKATMWTLDGRSFPAPASELAMAPCCTLYSTVIDLAHFLQVVLARGELLDGDRLIAASTLDVMLTPQFADSNAKTGVGIGFRIDELNGHRTVGQSGAMSGYSTSFIALPNDSLGVIVTAALDGASAVTDHIGRIAARMMLDVQNGNPLTALDTTVALSRERAAALAGRYESSRITVDLNEFEGHLYLTSSRGGVRKELRRPVIDSGPADSILVADDALAFGDEVRLVGDGIVAIGADTLHRVAAPQSTVASKPSVGRFDYTPLIGEYGADPNVVSIREKDGKLHALVDQFYDYPLERITRDVYRFPEYGLYDGQTIAFSRDEESKVTSLVISGVQLAKH